mmetsp:Transcript_37032/g.105996  ORF Transcript_37032/g.105996 Transcript_37032/m.105996 type:complete len:246 (-) Transcript_37032:236-973(-)
MALSASPRTSVSRCSMAIRCCALSSKMADRCSPRSRSSSSSCCLVTVSMCVLAALSASWRTCWLTRRTRSSAVFCVCLICLSLSLRMSSRVLRCASAAFLSFSAIFFDAADSLVNLLTSSWSRLMVPLSPSFSFVCVSSAVLSFSCAAASSLSSRAHLSVSLSISACDSSGSGSPAVGVVDSSCVRAVVASPVCVSVRVAASGGDTDAAEPSVFKALVSRPQLLWKWTAGPGWPLAAPQAPLHKA